MIFDFFKNKFGKRHSESAFIELLEIAFKDISSHTGIESISKFANTPKAKNVKWQLTKLAEKETRQIQKQFFIGIILSEMQDELLFKYLGNECPDHLITLYAFNMMDVPDHSPLTGIMNSAITNNSDPLTIAPELKKYYQFQHLHSTFITGSLYWVFSALFGKNDFTEDERRFKLMVQMHIKKIGAELLLSYSPDEKDVLSNFKAKYDYSEQQKRRELLNNFIHGIELNSEIIIDDVCDKFPKVLTSNYATYKDQKL